MGAGISFIGAGNVAFRFSLAMQEKRLEVSKIFNRSAASRDKVVKALRANGSETTAAEHIEDLFDSQLVIIAVADDAISSIVEEIEMAVASMSDRADEAEARTFPAFVHTSGATDIEVFRPLMDRGISCGVLYPLMTLKKNKNLDFKFVPMLLEASSRELSALLDSIATTLESEHYFKTSKERLKMHTAAVFTTNFINYMIGVATSIVQRDNPLLLPSTIEAVRNAYLHTPESTLTGPARRGDLKTIQKHTELLKEMGMEEQLEIYQYFTEKILNKYHK